MILLTALAALAVTFHDAARQSGITFVHDMGKSGQKMMVETMGSGGGFIDYDNDGDLDLYLVNGAPLPGYSGRATLANAMYRNDGQGRFTDVTAATRTGDTGYGMGICAGDYDNDGFTDFYLSNFGPDVLYHNEGDGTFTDVAPAAGVSNPYWSTSCAFLDYDRDGDLDLFVASYVDHTPSNNKFCGNYAAGVRAYCHPNVYTSQPQMLYRNEGDGTFTDASDAAKLTARLGNGLGVSVGDYDGDGDADIFVANDKTPNILYRNNGDGTFTDVTLDAGVGFSLDGVPQAGMGTDTADYDGDGDLDIVVMNLDFEYNALYRNEGSGVFSDQSFVAGIGAVSLSFVAFGTRFLDYDNDGRLDLAIANGHILDNAPYFNDATTYAERNFLFHGEAGGMLAEVGLKSGPDMKIENVGRGLFTGDVDGDGDVDILITVCGGAPRLLINDGGNAGAWLEVRLAGRASNRSALGARVRVKGPYGMMMSEVRSGSSYLSQSDLKLHFGFGTPGPGAAPPEIEVRWPSGLLQTVKPDGFNRVIAIVEGEGIVKP
jgi:hypothetical protein